MTFDYDLRGKFPEEINKSVVAKAVLQFCRFLRSKFYQIGRGGRDQIILAYDPRVSSRKISFFLQQFMPGVFLNVGLLTTPMFYWLVITRKKPGIMITASHLPYKYNGLKFLLPTGRSWSPEIKRWQKSKKWVGQIEKLKIVSGIYEEYFQQHYKILETKNVHKVKIDKNFWLPIFKRYFPLMKLEVNQKADFHFQSDLDVDRLKLWYLNKEILPDIIFRRIVLHSEKYKKLAAPINMSFHVKDELERLKKKIIYVPTGHKYIKEAYQKYKVDFAFEPSGHFYFFRELKTESPLLALKLYLEFFEKDDLELQQSLNLLRKNFVFKKTINLEKLVKDLKKAFQPAEIIKFDGFVIKNKNYQIHLRLSRTENKLRFSAEGDDSVLITDYLHFVKKWLLKN